MNMSIREIIAYFYKDEDLNHQIESHVGFALERLADSNVINHSHVFDAVNFYKSQTEEFFQSPIGVRRQGIAEYLCNKYDFVLLHDTKPVY